MGAISFPPFNESFHIYFICIYETIFIDLTIRNSRNEIPWPFSGSIHVSEQSFFKIYIFNGSKYRFFGPTINRLSEGLIIDQY